MLKVVSRFLTVSNLLISGLFSGVLVAYAAFINPYLKTLTAPLFLLMTRDLKKALDASVVPWLFFAMLIVPIVLLVVNYKKFKSLRFILNAVGTVLAVVVFVYTWTQVLPIYASVSGWTTSTIPSNWQQVRSDLANADMVKAVLSILSFVFFAVAATVCEHKEEK